jgi:hypothetical protein
MFAKQVTRSFVSKRILESRESLFSLVFVVFILAYAVDEFLSRKVGFSQYTVAVMATLTTFGVVFGIVLWDITVRRWQRFYLNPGEVIFARKEAESIVVKNTTDVERGLLDGCSDLTVVNVWPWVDRHFECLVGKHKTAFLLSLKVVSFEAEALEKWLRFSEADILSEIRNEAQELASQLGIGRALESPQEFAQRLSERLNLQLFGVMGVQISISPVAGQEDLSSSAKKSLTN